MLIFVWYNQSCLEDAFIGSHRLQQLQPKTMLSDFFAKAAKQLAGRNATISFSI